MSEGLMNECKNVAEAIVSISENAGGTGVFMSEICNVLPSEYARYHLLTCSSEDDPDLPLDCRVDAVKLRGIGSDGLGLKKGHVFSSLSGMDADQRLDLVHLHGIWLGFCHDVTGWALLQGRPLVVSPHGMLEPWALNHKKWKKRLAWWLYQKNDLMRARAFHACSEQEANSIRELGFRQPIAVIPNGVVLPKLKVEEAKVRDETKTALFLSRINPKKGLPMLLDAWAKLSPSGWRLVIAGNDDSNHLPTVQAKVLESGLEGQVEITGPLFGTEKESAFLNADLFVLPSYSENFGIVVTEALSYRVPVLTTKGCPWKELEEHACGWWVEPTPAGTTKGLERALSTSPEDLRLMGERGRKLVEDKYQWPSIGRDMNRFYKWLLGDGYKPEFVV